VTPYDATLLDAYALLVQVAINPNLLSWVDVF